MKPNLFIVGAPRSGTTSLYKMLDCHPNIFMAKEKELGHFLTEQKISRILYMSNFIDAVPGQHLFVGEASTGYLYDKDAAVNIHSFNPTARIIMIFRNPVDYLASYYDMHLYTVNLTSTELPFMHWLKSNLDMANYNSQAVRYTKLFKNVKILIFEQFINDPIKSYDEIIHWLGLEPYAEITAIHANAGRKLRYPKLKKFADKHNLKEKVAHTKIYPALSMVFNKIIAYPVSRTVSDDMKKLILSTVYDEIRQLEKLSKINLSKIWY